jgi:hypothetical protein
MPQPAAEVHAELAEHGAATAHRIGRAGDVVLGNHATLRLVRVEQVRRRPAA